MTAAVVYAAKSSEDKHGSIPTQIEDGHALAERDGLEVLGEYSDEAASAFKGNRGVGLQRALDHAEREGAALIVQHSDRLARGDGDRARHLVELVLWARKAGVTLRSVQDPQTFDGMGLVYAALMGDRNHEDSARKSASVRSGLARRKASGKPVGPIPFGYTVDKQVVNAPREPDPNAVEHVRSIFDWLEHGDTPGAVARKLNQAGVITARGSRWTARAVRWLARNSAYIGEAYPAIIERDQWQRVNDGLARMDPAAVQRRTGARPADDYLLKGLVFCARCGKPLWTRRLAKGRQYTCAEVRQATGLCDAPAIPAELIEGQVLAHIEAFVGDAEAWLAERRQESDQEISRLQATVDRHRAAAARGARTRELLLEEYRRQVAAGRSTAHLALEEVERIDRERAELANLVAQAEAMVEEHDVAADERRTANLVTSFRERVASAENSAALSAALGQALAGLWADIQDGALTVEFELADPDGRPADHRQGAHLFQHTDPVGLEARRLALPRHTGPHTFL